MSKLCHLSEHMSRIFNLNFAKIFLLKGKIMGRTKNIRNLTFKPLCQTFIPKDQHFEGSVNLLHEEIEAIYLMDMLGLYQEDAAKKMEVSRPTFNRILKSARYKLALGIISGFKIEIEDEKQDLIIAVCSDNDKSVKDISSIRPYIFFYRYAKGKLEFIELVDNPVYKEKAKLAISLPKLFLEHHVNMFVTKELGEGLKNSLISKGIRPVIFKQEFSLDVLVEYLKKGIM